VTRAYDPDRRVVLDRMVECLVTQSLCGDLSSVWEPAPDKYSNRVGFDVIGQKHRVESNTLSRELMIALTDSLNRSSTPMPYGSKDSAAR
jgi:hypothetical protein